MKTNMGNLDRTLRAIVGVIIVVAAVYYSSWWGLVAILPLGTALVGTCPAYLPFGLSTCKTEKAAS